MCLQYLSEHKNHFGANYVNKKKPKKFDFLGFYVVRKIFDYSVSFFSSEDSSFDVKALTDNFILPLSKPMSFTSIS